MNTYSVFAQGGSCNTASQICLASGNNFPASTDVVSLGQYGCLYTTPNPMWFTFQVELPGSINVIIESGGDVDFVCWGPFTATDLTEFHASNACNDLQIDCSACDSFPYGNMVDCSFSTAASENVQIQNALVGEWYVFLITNYANITTNFNFSSDVSSVGTSNCDFCAKVEGNLIPNFMLSPNPATDVLKCDFETIKNRNLTIVDVLGKTLISLESNHQNEVIDVKNLPNGVYFLNVEDENKSYSRKFIISK